MGRVSRDSVKRQQPHDGVCSQRFSHRERTFVSNSLVVIPTYCERENLAPLVERFLAADRTLEVLVVDDNSPDGTGDLADQLSAKNARIHVMHRPGKQGLGAAYIAGFEWALDRDYDYIFESDADGSHQPEQLPALMRQLEDGAGLVIGTRWMPGGETRNWPLKRQLLSKGGSLFSRVMLRTKLRDITSGFRGFRASSLRALDLNTLESQGYCFQIEMAWRAEQLGIIVREEPILFIERTDGQSKMSGSIVFEAMWSVFMWGLRDRTVAEPAQGISPVRQR